MEGAGDEVKYSTQALTIFGALISVACVSVALGVAAIRSRRKLSVTINRLTKLLELARDSSSAQASIGYLSQASILASEIALKTPKQKIPMTISWRKNTEPVSATPKNLRLKIACIVGKCLVKRSERFLELGYVRAAVRDSKESVNAIGACCKFEFGSNIQFVRALLALSKISFLENSSNSEKSENWKQLSGEAQNILENLRKENPDCSTKCDCTCHSALEFDSNSDKIKQLNEIESELRKWVEMSDKQRNTLVQPAIRRIAQRPMYLVCDVDRTDSNSNLNSSLVSSQKSSTLLHWIFATRPYAFAGMCSSDQPSRLNLGHAVKAMRNSECSGITWINLQIESLVYVNGLPHYATAASGIDPNSLVDSLKQCDALFVNDVLLLEPKTVASPFEMLNAVWSTGECKYQPLNISDDLGRLRLDGLQQLIDVISNIPKSHHIWVTCRGGKELAQLGMVVAKMVTSDLSKITTTPAAQREESEKSNQDLLTPVIDSLTQINDQITQVKVRNSNTLLSLFFYDASVTLFSCCDAYFLTRLSIAVV
eukprot:c13895_g1_i1.p1 GENE.c13895_g1_i1~~c13895_g1_i1.p1  ORF type:complete len:563 (-),score=136.28 c13895_g1_i1:622-2244(-)